MKRTSFIAFALAIALTANRMPLAAQAVAASPAQIGIMGGATFPRGSDFTNISKTGWNAGVLLSLGVPLFPLSFRLDGQWHQLGGKTVSAPDVGTARTDLRVIDGTANFVWTFGAPSVSNFYLIGGIGAYKLRGQDSRTPGNISGGTATTVTENATKFGWNAGAGFRFRLTGYSMFIEGRYHDISHGHDVDGTGSSKPLHFIPVAIGITL
jgi:opacity protein-like surface antigen